MLEVKAVVGFSAKKLKMETSSQCSRYACKCWPWQQSSEIGMEGILELPLLPAAHLGKLEMSLRSGQLQSYLEIFKDCQLVRALEGEPS